MEEVVQQNLEKDREIASLKAELAKIPEETPVPPKIKRGLFANIKEAVNSPRSATPGRTLRKTTRTQRH